ncbi:MAG TPA: SDR family oxidoreductase [Pseudonocardiaceae bacterium]|jgi:NAD(P)-dependent dehydrogenase (short-subunit alcohol dehydrogenase family)/pimeloyl-ACP methyl ester carboxylesterase|nr:SDR family oxidoreductase [Pseudonocardiaceae bacterium]
MNTVLASSVLVDGLRLAVTEQGDPNAPTVLLVHGYPDNSSIWDDVAAQLADRFHVVRYDVRGCGESEAPADKADYRLDQLAADLAVVVRAVSRDRPVHLVAHDWGSIQAWHAVTDPRYAELFASYTSISGPCLDHIAAWMRTQVRRGRLRPVLRQLAHSWYVGFFQLPVLPELAWRFPPLRRKLHATARDARNGMQLYRTNMFGRLGERGERRTVVPVQQIALTRDAYVTPALLLAAEPWCERLWRRELPFAHWAPREHPAVIAGFVAEFAEHIDGAPAGRGLSGARIDKPSRRFAGKLVLITGAGSGIGRATALAFAEQGADVVAVDIDQDSATATAATARQYVVDGHAYVADVSDGAGMQALAAKVAAEHGVPDIVMANAGIGMSGPFLATEEADWRRIIDVNLLGVVHTLRAFAPLLVDRDQGGHLVVTASAAAFLPWPMLAAYSTTKAAVLSLAQSLRTELAPHGIGVSAICPGIVATNITSTTRFVGQDAQAEQRSRQRTTALYKRRHYGPEGVAAAVVKAVRDNQAVVPVTPEAHLAAVGSRLSPGIVRAMGRWIRPPE